MNAVEATCRAHGLVLVESLASNFGVVARVVDSSGRELLLKSAQPDQRDCLDESRALEAWAGTGGMPRLVARYTDGFHLRDFVVGTPLTETSGRGCEHARGVGALLRELHAVAAPDDAPTTWLDHARHVIAASPGVTAAQRRRAARAAARLCDVPGTTLVHGDCYHRNIVVTDAGLVAIDPLARSDHAAADVATFVLTCPSDDVAATLAELTEGYAGGLTHVADYMDFCAIRNAHYRAAFEARADPGAVWQACFVADGDGLLWCEDPPA